MNYQQPEVAQTDGRPSEFAQRDQPVRARLPYVVPRLNALGDVRNLTLGGSIGRNDSGAPERQALVGGI
jgi:hypothetical protein